MARRSNLLFRSARAGIVVLGERAAHATDGRRPAVRSGQTGPRNQDFIQRYERSTTAFGTIVATLRNASALTPSLPIGQPRARSTL
jgi:hypothetical protein